MLDSHSCFFAKEQLRITKTSEMLVFSRTSDIEHDGYFDMEGLKYVFDQIQLRYLYTGTYEACMELSIRELS